MPVAVSAGFEDRLSAAIDVTTPLQALPAGEYVLDLAVCLASEGASRSVPFSVR